VRWKRPKKGLGTTAMERAEGRVFRVAGAEGKSVAGSDALADRSNREAGMPDKRACSGSVDQRGVGHGRGWLRVVAAAPA
jgi:hypothetical protein